MLQDIAVLTGGQSISEDLGMKLENVTLARMSFGDPNKWAHPYQDHAEKKGVACLRTHRSTHDLVHNAPHLLEPVRVIVSKR